MGRVAALKRQRKAALEESVLRFDSKEMIAEVNKT